MVRVFKKILRDRHRDRRLHWDDDGGDGGRWLRLRRPTVMVGRLGSPAKLRTKFSSLPSFEETGAPAFSPRTR
jgi:hypothetical protein